MIYDFHAHSVNSGGFGTVDELCGFAIEKGIAGFAVTDHADTEYYEERDTYNRIKSRFPTFLRLVKNTRESLSFIQELSLEDTFGHPKVQKRCFRSSRLT